MKRTCNGCKALNGSGKCELGHPVNIVRTSPEVEGLTTVTYKPNQRCLKPKTNADLADAKAIVKAMRFGVAFGTALQDKGN